MATSTDYISFVCEQIQGLGAIVPKKMFGEYLVYIDEKPILMVCDNTVFVKELPCLNSLLTVAEKGHPYGGAKEHYILDIENRPLTEAVIRELCKVTPKKRDKSKKPN